MADPTVGKRAVLGAALAPRGLQFAACNTLAGTNKNIRKFSEGVEDGAGRVGDAVDDAAN